MKTKVVFRIKKGEVIALFPEVPASICGNYCMSYMKVGQHAAATPFLYKWRPAKPEEYNELKKELEILGYDLEIIKKVTGKMHATRRKAAHESGK